MNPLMSAFLSFNLVFNLPVQAAPTMAIDPILKSVHAEYMKASSLRQFLENSKDKMTEADYSFLKNKFDGIPSNAKPKISVRGSEFIIDMKGQIIRVKVNSLERSEIVVNNKALDLQNDDIATRWQKISDALPSFSSGFKFQDLILPQANAVIVPIVLAIAGVAVFFTAILGTANCQEIDDHKAECERVSTMFMTDSRKLSSQELSQIRKQIDLLRNSLGNGKCFVRNSRGPLHKCLNDLEEACQHHGCPPSSVESQSPGNATR